MNIVYEFHQPSLNGTSSWLDWLGCPRRARLNAEARAQGYSSLGSSAQQVGTLVHAYLDLFHTGKLTEVLGDSHNSKWLDCISFRSWDSAGGELNCWHNGARIEAEVLTEAKRVFTAYVKLYEPERWGVENIGELTLGESEDERQAATGDHRNDWSGRLDLLSGDTSKGYVVVDHKCLARLDVNARISYAKSMQVKCYMLAAAAKGYDIRHGLINAVIKTKEVKVEEVRVEFPNRRERDEIYAFFRHVNVIRTQRKDEVNISKCFDFWGNCPYIEDASCNRVGS